MYWVQTHKNDPYANFILSRSYYAVRLNTSIFIFLKLQFKKVFLWKAKPQFQLRHFDYLNNIYIYYVYIQSYLFIHVFWIFKKYYKNVILLLIKAAKIQGCLKNNN